MRRITIILISLSIVLGCGNDTVVEPEPEPKINTPPVIDALILPQRVEAGTQVKLQIITRDAENDNLTVNWQVGEGGLDTATAVWTAPNRSMTVEITVFVTDGTNEVVSAKRNVQVVSVEPVEPTPPPDNPTIQPPVVDAPEPIVPEPEPVGQEEARIFPGMQIVVITPGLETIGVRLRQDIAELEQLYGKATPHVTGILMFNAPRIGEFGIDPNNNDEVAQIVIVDPRYKTAEGIGVGSTRAAVRKAFGEPDEANELLRFDQYRFKGITLAYDNRWKVEGIFIF